MVASEALGESPQLPSHAVYIGQGHFCDCPCNTLGHVMSSLHLLWKALQHRDRFAALGRLSVRKVALVAPGAGSGDTIALSWPGS